MAACGAISIRKSGVASLPPPVNVFGTPTGGSSIPTVTLHSSRRPQSQPATQDDCVLIYHGAGSW
eukprot:scaffold309871_cov36-Prasinocladus_malaysianus.AAC.1